MPWRILISCPPMLNTLESCQERFAVENLEVVAPKVMQLLSEAELCEIIADFDGVIAGDDPFTAKVLYYSTNYNEFIMDKITWHNLY